MSVLLPALFEQSFNSGLMLSFLYVFPGPNTDYNCCTIEPRHPSFLNSKVMLETEPKPKSDFLSEEKDVVKHTF